MNDPGICEACANAKTADFHCQVCGVHVASLIPAEVTVYRTEICGPCITADNERRREAAEKARTAWIQEKYVQISEGDQWKVLGEIYDELRDY